MSFHTTIARLREVAANRVQGEEPDTCRVRREDLRIALHVIDRLDSDLRAEGVLASTPVAGEAQPVCWIYRTHLEGLRDDGDDEASVYRREPGRAIGPDEVPLYAAPRASEAVRNEDVVRMVYRLRAAVQSDSRASSTVETHQEAAKAEEDLIAAIGAMTTQADKDGGDCAKGAGDGHA